MDQALSPARASLALLRGAYPAATITAETVGVYESALADLDPQDVFDAVTALVKESRFLPTIAEIREVVAEHKLALPSATEAWEEARARSFGTWDDPRNAIVSRAMQLMGGTYAIKTSENPSITQAQFLKHYSAMRADVIQGFVRSGRLPELEKVVTQHEVLVEMEQADGSFDLKLISDEPMLRELDGSDAADAA